jgi:hypothetical protein
MPAEMRRHRRADDNHGRDRVSVLTILAVLARGTGCAILACRPLRTLRASCAGITLWSLRALRTLGAGRTSRALRPRCAIGAVEFVDTSAAAGGEDGRGEGQGQEEFVHCWLVFLMKS